MATAIEAMIVAVSNMSFMVNPEYWKVLNNAVFYLLFHSILPEPFSRSRRLGQLALGKLEDNRETAAYGRIGSYRHSDHLSGDHPGALFGATPAARCARTTDRANHRHH